MELRRRRANGTQTAVAALWQPNPDHPDGTPNPQRLAVESRADILGYGGSAGSGKTDLVLGLAATQHKHSVIFRRVSPNLRGIIERSREIFNPGGPAHQGDSFNETLKRWNLDGGRRIVELESCQYEKDKFNQRGRPRDFYAFDEATEFTRSQIEFITGWNRSTDPNQRCRIVLTFNPPTDESGTWIIDYFLPWIAFLFPSHYSHPNPARPGELRWYATVDGKETGRPNGEPFTHKGEVIRPLSRTFIPGKLADNPHLRDTNYGAIIDSLPEPLRSQLKHGDFTAVAGDNPWQVIPTSWVKAAQKRWLEREEPEMPLSGAGVDVARGGRDRMVIERRRGTWFAEPKQIAGVNVEDGGAAAAYIYNELKGEAHIGYINIDVIGVGTSAYDSTKAMFPGITHPINASMASDYVVKSKGENPQAILRMKNTRAEYHWRLREALDPVNGENLALPPGSEIVADLCAANYKVLAGGVIQIEEKEAIKGRIGRSPDTGEAIMLAYHEPKTAVSAIGETVAVDVNIYKARRNR